MVILFFINVVVRTFGGTFASDLAWIEEAVRLMNIFLVFGALGLALERGRHVSIDSVRMALPIRWQSRMVKLVDAVGCLFGGYMAYLSWRLIVFVLKTGQRSPTLDIPMGWIYAAPFTGFSLLFLRYGLSFLGAIDRFPQSSEIHQADVTEEGG